MSSLCYVYIMKNELGRYKIGISSNVENRLRSLQTASGYRIKVLRTFLLEDRRSAQRLENLLHTKFKKNRKLGEWFDFTEEVLPDVYNTAVENSYKLNTNYLLESYHSKISKGLKPNGLEAEAAVLDGVYISKDEANKIKGLSKYSTSTPCKNCGSTEFRSFYKDKCSSCKKPSSINIEEYKIRGRKRRENFLRMKYLDFCKGKPLSSTLFVQVHNAGFLMDYGKSKIICVKSDRFGVRWQPKGTRVRQGYTYSGFSGNLQKVLNKISEEN